jgi:hypothetical protein
MDRGVIVGGGLIAASFLVAMLLNRSAHEEAHPVEAHPVAAPAALPAVACEERAPVPPGTTPPAEVEAQKCKDSSAEPALK